MVPRATLCMYELQDVAIRLVEASDSNVGQFDDLINKLRLAVDGQQRELIRLFVTHLLVMHTISQHVPQRDSEELLLRICVAAVLLASGAIVARDKDSNRNWLRHGTQQCDIHFPNERYLQTYLEPKRLRIMTCIHYNNRCKPLRCAHVSGYITELST